MFKKVFQVAVFLLVICILSPLSFAYRPLGTENAGVAGKGVSQLELGWEYLKWNGDQEQIFLAVPIYGVTENLELSLEAPYMLHQSKDAASHKGIGDINVVAKYLLLPENKKRPALALKGVIKLDNGDHDKGLGSGNYDYSIFAVASKTFKDLTLHAHLGYSWVGDKKDENFRNIFLYALAFDYGLTEAFHVVGEINGNRHPDRNEATDPRMALVGIIHTLSEMFVLDAALKRGLTSSAPDWGVQAGVSITF
ncbi:MAG: transporter [Syntrophales bacterium]|nr:transporter [Syntrophales bacterium]